jgi:hypothetical protein
MKNAPYRHIRIVEGGAELHTRKGWRGLSRASGANRRRKLTEAGASRAPLSKAYRLRETASTAPTWLWGRIKSAFPL